MKNRKHILLTIAVLFIGLIITGASYAFWSFTSGDKNLVFHTSSNLKKYIMYSDGEGIFSGTLQVGDDYTDGIHTTISLYKTNEAANVNLKATIHMDVNQIGTNMQSSKALKWAVTNGNGTNPGTVISNGDFVGVTNNADMILAANLDVTLTEKEYTIWIWLDERENPSSELTGETLDTNVWTEVNQYEGVSDVYEITKLSASYQVINATVINRRNKIVSYAVTDTTEEPASWTPIADNEQNNIYNLKYLAPSAGNYYVWFKDSKDKTITSDMITVTEVNENAPVCTFGEFSQSVVKNNGTATIDITCTDENTTIISDLKLSDLTRSGTTVTLTNLTKTKITNGYKYTVTVKAGTTAGNTSIILPADKVKNNFDLGNEQIQSSPITVNNDSTSPTFTLSVTDGGTYAKQRDATITIADNVRLRPGTYTIKYDWSTTALTCNQLGNTTDLVVSLGETTKTATLTITNKTGAGKLYVCNENTIYDEVGNQVAPNTLKSANMYLDNTGPAGELLLEVNGGVKATLNVTDSNAGIQTPYYYMIDDEPITCNENTTGFIDISSNLYVFTTEVTHLGMYYVCTKVTDKVGNTSYYSGSIEVKAYLKTLSGDNDAFKEAQYKTNITDIYFVNNMNIPAEAEAQYVLDETNLGVIKGWIIPNTEESGKYKLYIGSNNTIYGQDLTSLFSGMTGVKQISFDNFDTSEASSMYSMFYNCSSLTSLNLSNFDTSNVTTMRSMFYNCNSLTSLDLSLFDTSNVTTMRYMFNSCSGLTSVDLSGFNTSKVTDMSGMFNSCTNLTSLDLSNFDTSNVTLMGGRTSSQSGMFDRCTSLTSLNLSSFDTSKVTNMERMFYDCSKLTTLDLSSFDTSKVTSMYWMFSRSSNLLSIFVSSNKWNVGKVSNSNAMFSYCSNLFGGNGTVYNSGVTDKTMAVIDTNDTPGYLTEKPSANVLEHGTNGGATTKFLSTGILKNQIKKITFTNSISGHTANETDTWDVSWQKNGSVLAWVGSADENGLYEMTIGQNGAVKPVSGYYLFSYLSNLVSFEGMQYFDTSNVINMKSMFVGDTNLTAIDLSHFNTSNVTTMYDLFSGDSSLTSVNLSSFDTSKVNNMRGMFYNNNSLASITFGNSFNTSNVTNMYAMFYGCSSLTSLDLSGFNTSNVTNMQNMFYGCTGLTSLTFSSNFNTSNVTNMEGMFYNCSNLTSLDLSSFDTSNVTTMKSMFRKCNGLTSLDLSNFNTSNVTDMRGMFAECTKLLSLDLSNFNTTNVTLMGGTADADPGMFQSCSGLVSLNLSSFDTSKVTNMAKMFYNCSSLTSLDLSSFDTSKLANMYWMFNGSNNLLAIYVSSDKWDVTGVTNSTHMFNNCSSLVGGNGTAYSSSNVTKTYAVIDTDDAPGYLTAAPTENVLEPGSVKANTIKYLSTGILKNQIKKISFTNSITGHSANGTDTWDVSFQKNGSVLAWVGNADGNGLYEMTIGQAGGVKALNGYGLFSYLNNLQSIDGMEYFDVSDVTLMRSMFQGCSNLSTLDLSNWNTSKVKLMNNMFNGCSNLSTIYVSDLWDTSNLSNSAGMFTGATNLPNFNSSVVDATNANYGSSGYLTYKANS